MFFVGYDLYILESLILFPMIEFTPESDEEDEEWSVRKKWTAVRKMKKGQKVFGDKDKKQEQIKVESNLNEGFGDCNLPSKSWIGFKGRSQLVHPLYLTQATIKLPYPGANNTNMHSNT